MNREAELRRPSRVACNDLLAGIFGISIGCLIIIIVGTVSKLCKNPSENSAHDNAYQTEPCGETSASQLSLQEPTLPLLVCADKLWRITPNLRLKDGKLSVGQLGKDECIHSLETVSETLLPLQHVEASGSCLYIVVHVMRAMPANVQNSATAGLRG
jgi:hypothetical protein